MAHNSLQLCLFTILTLVGLSEGAVFTYTKAGATEPCILVDIEFLVDFEAKQDGAVVATATRTSSDSDISVSGSCGDINAVMNLRFKSGSNWALKFRKFDNGSADLDRLVQFRPMDVFGDKVPDPDYVSMDDPGTTDLMNSTLSYICYSFDSAVYQPVTVIKKDFNYSVVTNISFIHAQAFNLRDGKFSPQIECSQDFTSTSLPTTTQQTTSTETSTNTTAGMNTTMTPKNTTTPSPSTNTTKPSTNTTQEVSTSVPTTPMPGPPVNDYMVKGDNLTCIVFQVAMMTKIKYQAKQNDETVTKTTSVNVPADAVGEGSCGDSSATQQTLKVEFDDGWSIDMTFIKQDSLKSSSNSAQEKNAYVISNITLTYKIDEKNFPDSELPPGTIVQAAPTSTPDFPKKSANKGYYKCSSNLDLKLNDDTTVVTKDLEFKAFNADNDEKFSGSADLCQGDESSSSDKVAIILGSVLGGIVLVCLVFFIIVRCRKRRSVYSNI